MPAVLQVLEHHSLILRLTAEQSLALLKESEGGKVRVREQQGAGHCYNPMLWRTIEHHSLFQIVPPLKCMFPRQSYNRNQQLLWSLVLLVYGDDENPSTFVPVISSQLDITVRSILVGL